MKRIFVILIAALLLLPCLAAPAAAMDIAVDDGWDEFDDPYYDYAFEAFEAAQKRAERIEAGISFAFCVAAALVTLIVFIVLRAKKSIPAGRFLAALAVLAVFVAVRAVYLFSLF